MKTWADLRLERRQRRPLWLRLIAKGGAPRASFWRVVFCLLVGITLLVGPGLFWLFMYWFARYALGY